MVDKELVRNEAILRGEALSPAQDQDIANQQEFTGFVESIRKVGILPLPDLTPYIAHDGRPSDGLYEHLTGCGDRVFLGDRFYQFAGHDTPPDRLDFVPQPVLRMGKEDSRRGVFFGALRADWFNRGEKAVMQVAVTPVPSEETSSINRELSIHEVGMYQYLGSLSIPTMEVVGIGQFEKPKSDLSGFVVTRLIPDLTSLDTLEWNKMGVGEMKQYVGIALDVLATINSELFFRGDAEFKNICFRENQTSSTVPDLEFSTSARDIPENISVLAKLMSRELTAVRNSTAEYIIRNLPEDERPTDSIEQFEFMHFWVYEPYFERLVHKGGEYIDVLTKAYDLFIRQQLSYALGDEIPKA